MYTNILQCNYRAIPLLSAFPFPIPFCSPFVSLYLLGTLLAVIGSCPPRSHVARELTSPFPSPYLYTPHSKIPTPWGLPDPNIHFIRTTSRTWLTRSRTSLPLQGGEKRGKQLQTLRFRPLIHADLSFLHFS
jgi:hypothetical protein